MAVTKNNFAIPMYVTLCRIPQFSAHYYKINQQTDDERIEKLVDIALTYPFVNGLIKKTDNKFYLDGGLIDNNPIYPLLDENVDVVILLHCDPNYVPQRRILEHNKIVIDIDTTLCNKGSSKTFSLTSDNLRDTIEDGYNYRLRFCREVLKASYLKEELGQNAKKFIASEALKRRNKRNLLTIVSFFDKYHWSKDFN